MATRFWLPSTGVPTVSPLPDPAWDREQDTNGAIAYDRLQMVTIRPTSAFSTRAAPYIGGLNQRTISRQYVSVPMNAQTIAVGTIKGIVRAASTTGGWSGTPYPIAIYTSVRVVSRDGLTVRGTVFALPADGTALTAVPGVQFTNWVLTDRKTFLAQPAATTAVTTNQGDRLVIEFGFGRTGTPGFGFSPAAGRVEFGVAASDLPEDETGTAQLSPWVELSQNITWEDTTGGIIDPGAAPFSVSLAATPSVPSRIHDWRVFLCDRSGVTISELTALMGTSGQCTVARNTAAVLSGVVPANDPAVSGAHTDGLLRLCSNARTIKGFRREIDQSNWVTNPTADTNAVGWNGAVATGTSVISWSNTGNPGGAIRNVASPASGLAASTYQNWPNAAPVAQGDTVMLHADVKVISGTFSQIVLLPRYFDAAGTFISQGAAVQTLAASTTGVWNTVSGSFTVPAGVFYVAIHIQITCTNAAITFDVDNAALYRTSPVYVPRFSGHVISTQIVAQGESAGIAFTAADPLNRLSRRLCRNTSGTIGIGFQASAIGDIVRMLIDDANLEDNTGMQTAGAQIPAMAAHDAQYGVKYVLDAIMELSASADGFDIYAAPLDHTDGSLARLMLYAKSYELLANTGFETATTGWAGVTGGTVTRVTTQAYTGTASAQLSLTTTAGSAVLSSQVAGQLTPGVGYTFMLAAKRTVGTGPVELLVNWYNASGTFLSAATLAFTPTSAWALYTLTATAPVTADQFSFGVASQLGGVAHTIYIDAASAKETASGIGNYRPNVVFSWQNPPFNLSALSVVEDGTKMANLVAATTGSNDTVPTVVTDTVSQALYGLIEGIVSVSGDQTDSAYITGVANQALTSEPPYYVQNVSVNPETAPEPWTAFFIGDVVTVTAGPAAQGGIVTTMTVESFTVSLGDTEKLTAIAARQTA